MTSPFIVDDRYELIALQRVFREAKFSLNPDDSELCDSPIVCRLFERVISALVAADVALEGEDAANRWARWLTIDESREEWLVALKCASSDIRWAEFSGEEKIEQAKLLLSPFHLTPEILREFIFAVDHAKMPSP